jgi:type IV pilus assembly protein PilC
MPVYAYEARNEDGQSTGGMINAADPADAGRKLADQNLFVTRINPADHGGQASDDKRAQAGACNLKGGRKEVMWFMNQLAVMVETGIPIGESLDILSRQTTDPTMGAILGDISASIQEGRPLSDAMEAFPRTFNTVAIAMIRASETSGTLSIVLKRVSDYMMADQQAISRFRGALIYPAFMFMMCVVVTIFLLTVILPRFSAIYASKGAALPAPTLILMSVSNGLMNYGLYILAGLVAVTLAGIAYVKTPSGRAHRDWIQIRSPLFGPLFSGMFQCRTFRAIGTLLEAGVSISDTLQLAQNMSTNIWYKQLWRRVEEGVTDGQRIVVPLAKEKLLPESLIHMIDCGDRSGRMGFVFSRLSDYLEQEYERAIKVLSQFIEPLMVLCMGGIIGFVAIAMLLPMFKVASVVAH